MNTPETVVVEGVGFVHSFDSLTDPAYGSPREWYEHTDASTGWVWGLFRHLRGPFVESWYAQVADPREGRVDMLNTGIKHWDDRWDEGPLYALNPAEPPVLLPALVRLIRAGGWPQWIYDCTRREVPEAVSVTEPMPFQLSLELAMGGGRA